MTETTGSTDSTEEQADDAGSKRPRSKRGVPRLDLAKAEEAAKALWDVARNGAATESAFAKHLIGPSATASGGRWKTRVGSLKYFGVLESAGPGQLKLTDLGRRIVRVSEPEIVAAARRDAVLSVTPYREILEKSEGHELPARPGIVGTFQFDYALGEEGAKEAAENFESSVSAAGFVDAAGKVSLSGGYSPSDELPSDNKDEGNGTNAQDTSTDSAPDVDKIEDPPADPPAEEVKREEPKKLPAKTTPSATPAEKLVQSGTTLTADASSGVSIRIKLDMTHWQADDVVKVLNALGGLASR